MSQSNAGRLALAVLSGGAPLMLVALIVGGAWAEWTFVVVSLAFPPALILLAVSRERHPRSIFVVLAILWLVLELSAAAMLLGRGVRSGTVLGLPWSAAVMLVGLGLVPLLVVAFGYAATFRRPAAGPSDDRG